MSAPAGRVSPMAQILQTQTPVQVRFAPKDLENKERRSEIAKRLAELIRIAREKQLWIKIVRIYDYYGDVVPAGVWHNSVEINVVGEDEELESVAKELLDVYPYKDKVDDPMEIIGIASMVYRYSNTPRPSEHKYFTLWLTPYAHGVGDESDYAKRILVLIRKLDNVEDAVDALKTFINWCSTTIYCYSTRGNLSKVYDTGGDYPKWRVISTYWG